MARDLPPSSAFAADDGGTDPHLRPALAAEPADRLLAVVEALARARLLVPVVTHREDAAGVKQTSAALVNVATPDGRSALPVFSGLDSLHRWRPDARPVPVAGPRAALAAAQEADGLLVLDPAGPEPVLVPRPAVWALAQGKPWLPPECDDHVHAVVEEALTRLPQVRRIRVEAGTGNATRVILGVSPGLDRTEVAQITAAASEALAVIPVVADRIDALQFQVRAC